MKTYTSEQLRKMMDVIPEGTSIEQFQAVLRSGLIHDIFQPQANLANRLAVREALGLELMESGPGHVVDYSMSFEKMVRQGNYKGWKHDWKIEDLIQKFKIEGEGVVEFEDKLFEFQGHASTERSIAYIEAYDSQNPWTPAKAENVAAYGAKNPKDQLKYNIVGLGSACEASWDPKGKAVLVLDMDDDKQRRILTYGWSNKWGGVKYRLLGVRKKVKPVSVS